MNYSIDIVLVTYQRKELTERCLRYINERTRVPYRIFVVDNASTDGTVEMLRNLEADNKIYMGVYLGRNLGIHMGWNIGASLINSKYFVTMDNDVYVPDYDGKCWLERLYDLMEDNSDYGAIALQPHVFLGAGRLPEAINGVHELNMCGAVGRIMRRDLVRGVGGWEYIYDANRNHEEKTICSRMQTAGFKVGYAQNMKAYHDFGDDNNWGYKDIHPHKHGHRIPGDEIWPPPEKLNNPNLNNKTWEEK